MDDEYENGGDDPRDYERDPDWRGEQTWDFEVDETHRDGAYTMILTASISSSREDDKQKEYDNSDDLPSIQQGSDLGLSNYSNDKKAIGSKKDDEYRLGKALYDGLNATVGSVESALGYAEKKGFNDLYIPKGLDNLAHGLSVIDAYNFADDYMDDMANGNYRGAFATSFNFAVGAGLSAIPAAGPFFAFGYSIVADQYDWAESIYDVIQGN